VAVEQAVSDRAATAARPAAVHAVRWDMCRLLCAIYLRAAGVGRRGPVIRCVPGCGRVAVTTITETGFSVMRQRLGLVDSRAGDAGLHNGDVSACRSRPCADPRQHRFDRHPGARTSSPPIPTGSRWSGLAAGGGESRTARPPARRDRGHPGSRSPIPRPPTGSARSPTSAPTRRLAWSRRSRRPPGSTSCSTHWSDALGLEPTPGGPGHRGAAGAGQQGVAGGGRPAGAQGRQPGPDRPGGLRALRARPSACVPGRADEVATTSCSPRRVDRSGAGSRSRRWSRSRPSRPVLIPPGTWDR
jgi:hypothetical protein